MGGLAYMTGPPGQPLRAGASVIDVTGGMFGVIGILAALEERHRTGRGQKVAASLFETTIYLVGQHMAQYAVTGILFASQPLDHVHDRRIVGFHRLDLLLEAAHDPRDIGAGGQSAFLACYAVGRVCFKKAHVVKAWELHKSSAERAALSGGLLLSARRPIPAVPPMALSGRKPFGASAEMTMTLDTNINRATTAGTLDMIIGAFNLDDKARATSGILLGLFGTS